MSEGCGCAAPAVDASGLSLRPAPGAPVVIRDAAFSIPRGCRAALVGPNGAGKSTLLRAIAGLAPVASGELRVHGEAAAPGRADVALLFQRPSLTQGFPCTVRRLAEMGRIERARWGFSLSREDRDRAEAAVGAVGLGPMAGRLLHELSGGQLQRALVARALAQGATLLLLDEPYAGLDAASRGSLDAILFGPALAGATVVVTTHDPADSSPFDRVLAVEAGAVEVRVACEGRHPHRQV
jgi:manganese/zinc/iron transport system ATP- binding protein